MPSNSFRAEVVALFSRLGQIPGEKVGALGRASSHQHAAHTGGCRHRREPLSAAAGRGRGSRLRGLLQRADHAAEVTPGRAFRGVRVPARDRADHRQVFRQRDVCPARPQGKLELVPDDLGVEPPEQVRRHGLAGHLVHELMQLAVERRVLQRLALRGRPRHPLADADQPLDLGVAGVLGGLRGAQPFQHHAALGDRHRLRHRDGTDAGTPVRDTLDQAFRGQGEEGGPDAGPGNAQRFRQLRLHEALTRGPCPRS